MKPPLKTDSDGKIGSKKKIIFVIKGVKIGGTERHLIGLVPRLCKDFDVTVFSFHSGTIVKSSLEHVQFDKHDSSPTRSKSCNRMIVVFNLCRLLVKNREAIIHFILPEPYIIGGLCSVFLGIPHLIMSRRSLNLYQKNHWMINRVEKLLHKKMRMIIANSNAVARDLISENVPKTKISLIYNPVEVTPLLSDLQIRKKRERFGFGFHELIIVCVANLIPYKGHSDLLGGLASVSQKLPCNWKLILIGRDDGNQVYLEQESISLGLKNHIVFEGEKINIYDYLSISDIGVLPSHQEGFSNSILEGMASGLPMVVTDVGGNSEAVDDKINGLIVPAKDPTKLGEALLTLAYDKTLRKKMGIAARTKVKKRFTWDNCMETYQQVYLKS